MRKGGITRRWMVNSLTAIVTILLVFGVAFVLAFRSIIIKASSIPFPPVWILWMRFWSRCGCRPISRILIIPPGNL